MFARGAFSQYPFGTSPDPYGQKPLGVVMAGVGAMAADATVTTVNIVMTGTGSMSVQVTSSFLQLLGSPKAPIVYTLEVGLWAVSDRAAP